MTPISSSTSGIERKSESRSPVTRTAGDPNVGENGGRVEGPKILLVANTDWYLYNFRLSLAEKLRREGWAVTVVSPPGDYARKLQEMGLRWVSADLATRTQNPLRELKAILDLTRLYRRERPTVVHHFTVKPVLFGGIAARLAGGIPTVSAITGTGYVFTGADLKARMLRRALRALYRFVFAADEARVIFQNEADLSFFVDAGLVERSRTRVIRGSGVDCERFTPVVVNAPGRHDTPRILFGSRMLWDKGVGELVEVARIFRERRLDAAFLFAGDIYPDNPTSLTESQIQEISKEPSVTYLGHVEDMPRLIGDCDIVVLPSYAEGTPRILLEAAAMAKPIVATDIPGCHGIVEEGVNGFLVPVRSVGKLADALEALVLDPELRDRFGRAGRRIVLSTFQESIVLSRTRDVYREIVDPAGGPEPVVSPGR